MTLGQTLRAAWSEHGTWAILLTAFALGALASRPPTWVSFSTLVGLAGFAVTKTVAARVWRTREGWFALLPWSACSAFAFLPLALSSPRFVLFVGALGGPFLALFAWEAREPKWTRTLPVEFAGTLLLSTSAGLAFLSAKPYAGLDAPLAAGAAAALFLPGLPRARLLKGGGWGLRLSMLLLALAGAATLGAYAYLGVIAPWGALAALVFVGDVRAFWVLPVVTARHLGLALTLRGVPAALLVALAWRAV